MLSFWTMLVPAECGFYNGVGYFNNIPILANDWADQGVKITMHCGMLFEMHYLILSDMFVLIPVNQFHKHFEV